MVAAETYDVWTAAVDDRIPAVGFPGRRRKFSAFLADLRFAERDQAGVDRYYPAEH